MREALTDESKHAPAEGPGGPPRRARLLIVDDEEGVRVTTAAILEQEGYVVSTARAGAEALEALRRSPFDVVLTDLRLEDMDGARLLRELRATHPEVVTVVLTGYASIENAIDALREGVYDYLVKPCTVEDLKRTVRRAAEQHARLRRVRELSSPVVEIWDGVLLLPIVGTLDDARAELMSSELLDAVRTKGAGVVIIDVTGCTVVDTYTAGHLINSVRAVRLLGAAAIVTGVSAGVAADLVKLGVHFEDLTIRRRLADGLRLALKFMGVDTAGAGS